MLEDSQRREHEADEERTAVAHEDPGRMRVPAQKSQDRPHECGEDEAEEDLSESKSVQEEDERGAHRHPCREPVHVVEEVEGVRDSENPEEAQDEIDRRDPRELHLNAAADGNGGRRALAEELETHVKPIAEQVVEKPDAEHDEPARKQADKRGEDGVGFRKRRRDIGSEVSKRGHARELGGEGDPEADRRCEREEDGDAAEPRDGRSMFLAAARLVEEASRGAEADDPRKQQARPQERHEDDR